MIVAVVDPGMCVTEAVVSDGPVVLARFEADGGLARLPELLALVFESFDVDEWRLVRNGWAGPALSQSEEVADTCRLLGIHFVWEHVQVSPPARPGWPSRFVLFPRLARWAGRLAGWLA